MIFNLNCRAGILTHVAIPINTEVRIQDPISKDWSIKGTIVSIGRKRDYRIQLPNGRIYWRNRRFIRTDKTPINPLDRSQPTVSDNIDPPPTSPGHHQCFGFEAQNPNQIQIKSFFSRI